MNKQKKTETEHVAVEETDGKLNIGIISTEICSKGHQNHKNQREQCDSHDNGIDYANIMILPVVDTPEGSENEESNYKGYKLRLHSGENRGEFYLCFRFGKVRNDETGDKQGHGERKNPIHKSLEPVFQNSEIFLIIRHKISRSDFSLYLIFSSLSGIKLPKGLRQLHPGKNSSPHQSR